jgi:hypothetical protein
MNRGASLDGHISPTDGGPLRVNDGEGFADGAIPTTTGKACDATNRGERHRVPGNAGVADSWVMCQKTAADTYEWTTVSAAGGPFVLKAGDTMTGALVLREATDEKASIEDYAADALGPNIGFKKSRHATPGSHTVVQSGDDLGAVVFYGSDGTNYDVAAYIGAEVDGTPGSGTDMPGRLVFFTSPDGSATPAERLRIAQDGGITHAGLAGTGTRVVEASSTGLLSATGALSAVWLETLSPSAASTSSSGSVFSATYEAYLIVYRLSRSADATLTMRLRVGGADESGANTYYTALSSSGTILAITQSGATGLTSILLSPTIGAVQSDNIGAIWIASPFAADETVLQHHNSSRYTTPGSFSSWGASHRNATTSYDAFTIFPASGTITGTIRTYGIRNS